MIVVREITKRFGDLTAVDAVSLTVGEGSLTALLGPSGSGKSTLLRVVAGLEAPDAGSVAIAGVDVTAAPPQKRGIGFVFQHYAAFKHMTVRDNVAFALRIRRRPRREIRARVDELLALVGLDGLAERHPAQISGGQRQRMALARALAAEPRVLLLDEPFGALDTNVRAELRTWLRRLHEEIPLTTVLVTHDVSEAMDVADTVAVLREGRIEQAGAPGELYDNPRSEFVMRFLGPVSRVGGALVRPHEVTVAHVPREDAHEAIVTRVVQLGSEVRVELAGADGAESSAQLTRTEAAELELRGGDIVWLSASSTRPDRPPAYAPSPAAAPLRGRPA